MCERPSSEIFGCYLQEDPLGNLGQKSRKEPAAFVSICPPEYVHGKGEGGGAGGALSLGQRDVFEVLCWLSPPALLGRCPPRPPELLQPAQAARRVMAAAIMFSAAFPLPPLPRRKKGPRVWPQAGQFGILTVILLLSVTLSSALAFPPLCLGQALFCLICHSKVGACIELAQLPRSFQAPLFLYGCSTTFWYLCYLLQKGFLPITPRVYGSMV